MEARRRGYASILSLFAPGSGQIYYGRWGRGVALAVGEGPVEAAAALMLLHVPAHNVAASLGLFLAWRLWAAVDALRIARRQPVPSRLPVLRVPVALVACVALTVAVAFGVSKTVVEAYRVPTRSMMPTIQPDERLVADRLAYLFRDPRRGELVVYRLMLMDPEPSSSDPDGGPREVNWIKRVVGLPGERVEVRGHRAFVDGEALDEPYALVEGDGRADFGPVTVPEGSYFVLGDNRPKSVDSRQKGFVSRKDIFARAGVVFDSIDSETGEMRWDRIGRVLE